MMENFTRNNSLLLFQFPVTPLEKVDDLRRPLNATDSSLFLFLFHLSHALFNEPNCWKSSLEKTLWSVPDSRSISIPTSKRH